MVCKPCTRPWRLHKDCSALRNHRPRALRPPPPPPLHAGRVAALHITMATMRMCSMEEYRQMGLYNFSLVSLSLCTPLGESKRSEEVYRRRGQRNESRKWIHLSEGVNAVIFCAAISEYDQLLFEDKTPNKMMETKELFDWVLKQRCFEKTSFVLFLNKFERKIQRSL